jgi:tripartite-type tricarboxylate transporter receptor subunit TctC
VAANKAASDEELRKNFATQGMLPRAVSPAAFNDVVRKDYARWVKVVQDIGFKPE